MIAGPSTMAAGSIVDPLPSQTPGRSGNPSISTWTRPSWMSWWALRYASVVPTSSQYPSATYPKIGRPASRTAGKTSPEKSTARPSGMKSKISGSST